MMCGFVGFCNLNQDLSSSNNIETLKHLTRNLSHNEPNEEDFYISKHLNLGHRKLIMLDSEKGKQPISYKYNDNIYTIVYNGKLYNAKDIRKELITLGYEFESYCDTEVVLKSFIHYGTDSFKEFNGTFSFAIWNENKKELVLCRDHFGIKPLYYTITDNTLIFASEIKSILKYPGFEIKIDKQGICELLGIGPAHTPGTTVFKNIYEIKPAHYSVFNGYDLKHYKYWHMETNEHTDSFKTTCDTVRFLLNDSIKKQLVSNVPLCTMLSGGLDSSIIVASASNYLKDNKMQLLDTFSIDYVDNDKNFVKSDFQPNSDNYYIDIMKKEFNTNHHSIVIDTPELAKYLEDAMIARDFPGMADVDSSLLLFCKNIKEHSSIALSGECSDEIFAGYPWFFREDALTSNTFPWSLALDERQHLLNPKLSKDINLKDYINYRYKESINEIEFLDTDSKDTKEKRVISYLTLNWFMQTLLDRSDRMSMYNGLELRVPFCDYRLVQYMWNVPWDIKALNGREKGLLRYVVKDLLPNEIVNRRKSPYPKTHNPTYLKTVKGMLLNVMNNSNSPINDLLNGDYILEILATNGNAFTKPWFGQLMTGPQLIAYLVQVNMWLETYKPKIEI